MKELILHCDYVRALPLWALLLLGVIKELILHCDYVRYIAERRTKLAESIEDSEKSKHLENVPLVKMAIEKEDGRNVDSVAGKVVDDLKNLCERIKPKNALLYPCVHLLFGAEPAGAAESIELMELVKSRLKESGHNVSRAPFGWDKTFEIKCKARPLSKLSRIIRHGVLK